VPVHFPVVQVEELLLFDVRQEELPPAVLVGLGQGGRREAVVGVVVVVQGEAELFEVVSTAPAVGSLAHLLHRRQGDGYRQPDDGDHHQELDQREGRTLAAGHDTSPKGKEGGTERQYCSVVRTHTPPDGGKNSCPRRPCP